MSYTILLSELTNIDQLLVATEEILEHVLPTKFPKHNIQNFVNLYNNNNQKVIDLMTTLQKNDISLDTFLIMSQMMYFTNNRIFLVALPQLEASIKLGTSKPSHDILLSNDIVRSGAKVSKTLNFSLNFKASDDILIEKRAIIFSCNSKSQFLQNLVNTGKEYAYFFYRAWEGIFPNLLSGILYDDFINFLNEFDDISDFEAFLFNWGFHIDNPFYKENPDLAIDYSTSIKQWFSDDSKYADTERENLLDTYQDWLLNKLNVDDLMVSSRINAKLLANKINNGFFAIPNSNLRFLLVLLAEGIIPDHLLESMFIVDYFKYSNIVVGDSSNQGHYGIKRIFNTQPDYSITQLGDDYELSISTLSPSIKSYFGNTIWNFPKWLTKLDAYLKTDIDILLVLVALKVKKSVKQIFEYASTGDKTKLSAKEPKALSYTTTPLVLLDDLKKLYESNTLTNKSHKKHTPINPNNKNLQQAFLDNVIAPVLWYDFTSRDLHNLQKAKCFIVDTVSNKLTIDLTKLETVLRCSPDYDITDEDLKQQVKDTVKIYIANYLNESKTLKNRDLDKEEKFVLNLINLVL